MFVFHDAELTNIALHNDLSEFIENLEYNNELTLEDKQFIGLFLYRIRIVSLSAYLSDMTIY